MGKALLDELSLTHKGSLICCINRGKTYWYLLNHTGTTKPENIIRTSLTSIQTERITLTQPLPLDL